MSEEAGVSPLRHLWPRPSFTPFAHDFLHHVERTRILVHLVDGAAMDPLGDDHKINRELDLFKCALGTILSRVGQSLYQIVVSCIRPLSAPDLQCQQDADRWSSQVAH